MKLNVLTVLIFCISFSNVFAQTYRADRTPILNHLYEVKEEVSLIFKITNWQLIKDSLLPSQINSYQKLIKNKSGLYILYDGMGIILKAISADRHYIYFQRIDKSYFGGYNNNSFDFSFHDTIHSLGGYGFWRTNGMIRYFDHNEWQVKKTNEENEILPLITFYQPTEGEIFLISAVNPNDFLKQPSIHAFKIPVFKIDLKENNQTFLGYVDPQKIVVDFSKAEILHINIPNLGGSIVFFNKTPCLLDFHNNQAYLAKNPRIFNYLFRENGSSVKLNYAIGNTIYFTKTKNGALDSLQISRDDFQTSPIKIYKKPLDTVFFVVALGFLTICFGGLLLWIKKRKRFKTILSISENESPITTEEFNDAEIAIPYLSIEKELIHKIYRKSTKNLTVSVDEINAILGLSKKSLEVQKKLRTEMINKINHKFKVNHNSEETLISRLRSIEDRRYIKYTIEENLYNQIKNFL